MSPRGEHLNNRSQSLSSHTGAHQHHGFQSAGSILRSLPGDLVVTKQKLRRAEAIACVRLKRQEANQNLGFASRPFVLCGLPIKKPAAAQLLHERRNVSGKQGKCVADLRIGWSECHPVGTCHSPTEERCR